MYTRCTACRTVFHISVAELRAADGQVVCGRCDEEFDALENLSDTLPSAREEPDETPEVAETPGDVRDEDDFLREVESLIVDEPTAEQDEDFPDPDEVFRIDDDEVRMVLPGSPDSAEETAPETDEAAADAGSADSGEAAGETAVGEAEVPEPVVAAAPAVRQEPVETADTEPLPLADETPRRRRWPRVLLLALIALVVAGAWVHTERGRLLRHPAGQAVLAPVYRTIGIEAFPLWSPGDLRVLRSATVADPDSPGKLRVTVEFRNTATFAQPYPVLRVNLEDRWGQSVESRDFRPSEYREGHVAGRRLAAGERVQATVSLPDPGARADGFRIDLCLEGPGGGLRCATESSP